MDVQNAALSFGRRTQAYETFRISYPPELFDLILASAPNMKHDLAVDLGSGTGISAQPLTKRFKRVIAVEPDARMAERIPKGQTLDVRVGGAEDFRTPPGSVDLITSGTAFYWMDGPKIVSQMADWLHKDGAVAVYRYALPNIPAALAEIIDAEFREHWDQFRHPRLLDEAYSWNCFKNTPLFAKRSVRQIPHVAKMNFQTIVGFFGSTSYVGAYLRSIPDPDQYLLDLGHTVRSAMGDKPFDVDFPTELILASEPKV